MVIKTGIPKLDELMNGGLEKNKSLLLCAEPGVENQQFAQQILYTQLKNGGHGLYFVNNKKPALVKHSFESYDWDLTNFNHKVFSFIDCYSSLFGLNSTSQFFIKNPSDINEIETVLIKAMDKLNNNCTILIFDSLSTLFDQSTDKKILVHVNKWLKKAKQLRINPVFLFTKWPYPSSVIKSVRETFDYVVDLKAVERKVILRKYFTVSKGGLKKEIPFKICYPGGVKVYIPKILVTGPFNAGKTSFIHSASTKAVSVDRLGTTVALDHGHVDYKGFAVDLWGTPGQERFDPILKHLSGESLGVLVVIDSTNPKGFVRAKNMLEKSKTEGLPSVIVANKANLKGALKPAEIRKRMKIPKEISIIPVVADDLKKVKENHPCKLRKEDIEIVLSKLFEAVV